MFRTLGWRPWPAALFTVALIVSGCTTDTPATPSNGAPYSQTDLRVGTGAEAGTTGQVTVNYTGWLYDPDEDRFERPAVRHVGRQDAVRVHRRDQRGD